MESRKDVNSEKPKIQRRKARSKNANSIVKDYGSSSFRKCSLCFFLFTYLVQKNYTINLNNLI